MNQTGRILEEVKKAVCGKDRVLVWVLTVLLARGHVLLEDIPGVGKTTMALAFSRALGLEYGRVQFTPDVLPSDITGYSVYQKENGRLVYQPGAVLCNLFLADELNRATFTHAVRTAGSNGGGAGHSRWCQPPDSTAIHRLCHAEPDRSRRYAVAAGFADGPVRRPAVYRISCAGR